MIAAIANVCLLIHSALAAPLDDPARSASEQVRATEDEATQPRRVLDLSVGRRAALAQREAPIGPALPLRLEHYELDAAPMPPVLRGHELPQRPRNLSLTAAAPEPPGPFELGELDLGREMRRWRLSRPGWQVYYGPCSGAPIPMRCLR